MVTSSWAITMLSDKHFNRNEHGALERGLSVQTGRLGALSGRKRGEQRRMGYVGRGRDFRRGRALCNASLQKKEALSILRSVR